MTHPRPYLQLVYSAPAPATAAWRLTGLDLITVHEWMHCAGTRGYHRARTEPGNGGTGPEDGGYVLLYGSDGVWADWGLSRVAGGIEVWHCSTGVDLGCFKTMLEALESLPPARPVKAKAAALPSSHKGAWSPSRVSALNS